MGVREKSKVTGFQQLDYLLGELPNRVAGQSLQKAVNKAMLVGKRAVKKAAPKSTGKQSKASEKYGHGRDNIRLIKLKQVGRDEKAARVNTGDAFWLLFYELGTRYQKARPFFQAAIEGVRDEIFKTLGDTLGKVIEDEATKLARKRSGDG